MPNVQSPKWALPKRCNCLALILCDYLERDGWQVDIMSGEYYHPDYEARIEPIISDWKADDRAETEAIWKAEARAIHSYGEARFPVRGRFSAISKVIYHTSQPQYYLVGLGFSGVTLLPFARVRLASSFVGLDVDIDVPLHSISKNKRRKAIRYGKALPMQIQDRIDYLCNKAVRHFLG